LDKQKFKKHQKKYFIDAQLLPKLPPKVQHPKVIWLATPAWPIR
jgi:hypothetical protein